MNSVVLIGRLVDNPELKYIGESNIPITKFKLAVSRNYKSKDGIYKADFINIEVWNKQAEISAKYLSKGKLIAISGSLRVEDYLNSNGEYKSITKVLANHFQFLDSKNQNNKKQYSASEIFEEVTEPLSDNPLAEMQEDDLPF